ncbi:hypothetical protein SAMN05216312_108149 [Cohnella sp. OV330]|uniref:hypothetical protein n=1 Tax=Cohnella sp. OV330 TaxID=1855288 RepID=UPI0008EC4ED0|nr:hypothetical protein [Cohnella sp. OV330]SFB44403.1 hypothetical protein SAMN05216312_108149 [Cohnella sp. OV330]
MAVRPNARTRKSLQAYQGQPVCILMKDGTYYVGLIGDIKGGELTLSGVRGSEKWNPQAAKRSWQKAKISALGAAAAPAVPAAEAAAPGTGAGSAGGVSLGSGLGGLGGLDDLMGFMQKALPLMKMGMDMIKTIMPLMGGLKM